MARFQCLISYHYSLNHSIWAIVIGALNMKAAHVPVVIPLGGSSSLFKASRHIIENRSNVLEIMRNILICSDYNEAAIFLEWIRVDKFWLISLRQNAYRKHEIWRYIQKIRISLKEDWRKIKNWTTCSKRNWTRTGQTEENNSWTNYLSHNFCDYGYIHC